MKNEPQIQPELASPAEFWAAVEQLNEADRVRLRQLARLRVSGTRWTWEDLLQECFTRTLEGKRNWPKHDVELMAYLAQTLRSIAYDERQEMDVEVSQADLSAAEQLKAEHSAGHLTPERQLAAEQNLSEVEALFKDDEIALTVLVANAESIAPETIREELGLDSTQYATVLRRIRRKLIAFKGSYP